jgi:hypothetical protein
MYCLEELDVSGVNVSHQKDENNQKEKDERRKWAG